MTSKEFKAARRRLDLSQAKLADLLEISSNTVARYERDELQIEHPSWLAARMREIELELTKPRR